MSVPTLRWGSRIVGVRTRSISLTRRDSIGRRVLRCGHPAGHTPYMGYRGPRRRTLLLAGRHRKKGLLTVKVPVVPRSGIRQGRPSTAPPHSSGGYWRRAVRSVAHGAVAADHRGPCPCRGRPVSRGADAPCGGATAQHYEPPRDETASQQKPRRRPRAAAPSTGRGSCYDRASRLNPIAFATRPRRAATPMRFCLARPRPIRSTTVRQVPGRAALRRPRGDHGWPCAGPPSRD